MPVTIQLRLDCPLTVVLKPSNPGASNAGASDMPCLLGYHETERIRTRAFRKSSF